jgi:hypothetical protein
LKNIKKMKEIKNKIEIKGMINDKIRDEVEMC